MQICSLWIFLRCKIVSVQWKQTHGPTHIHENNKDNIFPHIMSLCLLARGPNEIQISCKMRVDKWSYKQTWTPKSSLRLQPQANVCKCAKCIFIFIYQVKTSMSSHLNKHTDTHPENQIWSKNWRDTEQWVGGKV